MDTTSSAPEEPRKRHRSRLGATLRALIRARVTAGLLIVLPIWITYLLVRFIFGAMRDASQWAVLGLLENPWVQLHITKLTIQRGTTFDVVAFLNEHPYIDWGLAIVSVLLTVLFLYAIGVFTANFFGRRLIGWLETLVDRVPLVKTVYRGSKQVLATFTGKENQNFQRVAMFPFLAPGVYSIGFITSVFKDPNSGEEYVTIFYATTPNPTTGFVFVLRRSDVVELDWTIEEAVKAVMSGGILMPSNLSIPQNVRWRELAIPGATFVPPGATPAVMSRPPK
jgi:uncharacterized membrane protein